MSENKQKTNLNEERKLYLAMSDDFLAWFICYLKSKAENGFFKDDKVKQVIQKHFFGNSNYIDVNSFDVNKFILHYIDSNSIDRKEFAYRFAYAMQDLKIRNKPYMINRCGQKFDYNFELSGEIVELLEVAQYCVRIGKNCKVRVNNIEDQRAYSPYFHSQEKHINIIDTNNYFNLDGIFKMNTRVSALTPENHYKWMADAIIHSSLSQTDNDKTVHIIIPGLSAWGGSGKELIEEIIIKQYINAYHNVSKKFKDRKIKFHPRINPKRVKKILNKLMKSGECMKEDVNLFTLDMYTTYDSDFNTGVRNQRSFPSNDKNNEWFWVTAGDHIVIYGNDHLLDFKTKDPDERNNSIRRIIGCFSDEYFNVKTDFYRYLGCDYIWDNPFDKYGHSNFYTGDLQMPINNFKYEGYNPNIDYKTYKQDFDEQKKIDEQLQKKLIANNHENVFTLAEKYRQYKNDNTIPVEKKDIFYVKEQGGKYGGKGHYSWWVFPSNSKTQQYDIKQDDAIYIQIASSDSYLSAFTDILQWITESRPYLKDNLHMSYIDFNKVLQCYNRIYNSTIKRWQSNKRNYYIERFIQQYYLFASSIIKNVTKSKEICDYLGDLISGNGSPLYDTGNVEFNNNNKKLLLQTMLIGIITHPWSNQNGVEGYIDAIVSAIDKLNGKNDKITIIDRGTDIIDNINCKVDTQIKDILKKKINNLKKQEINKDNINSLIKSGNNNLDITETSVNSDVSHVSNSELTNQSTLMLDTTKTSNANEQQITQTSITTSTSTKQSSLQNSNDNRVISSLTNTSMMSENKEEQKIEKSTLNTNNNVDVEDNNASVLSSNDNNQADKNIIFKNKEYNNNKDEQIINNNVQNDIIKNNNILDKHNGDIVKDNAFDQKLIFNNDNVNNVEELKPKIIKQNTKLSKTTEKTNIDDKLRYKNEKNDDTKVDKKLQEIKLEDRKHFINNDLNKNIEILDSSLNKDGNRFEQNRIFEPANNKKSNVDNLKTQGYRAINSYNNIPKINNYKPTVISINQPFINQKNSVDISNDTKKSINNDILYNNSNSSKTVHKIKKNHNVLQPTNQQNNQLFKIKYAKIQLDNNTEPMLLNQQQLEELLETNELKIKKQLSWKTGEVATAVFLCLLGVVMGIIYIVYKVIDIENANKDIKKHNYNAKKKRQKIITCLNSLRENSQSK